MELTFGNAATKIIGSTGFSSLTYGEGTMILVACELLYLAIWK